MKSLPTHGLTRVSRLLASHIKAGDDGLECDSVMLCEVTDGEIQSVSLRVAACAPGEAGAEAWGGS